MGLKMSINPNNLINRSKLNRMVQLAVRGQNRNSDLLNSAIGVLLTCGLSVRQNAIIADILQNVPSDKAKEAAAAKESQKHHGERRRRRKTSFAESSNGSTTASSTMPSFLRIMTQGKSDCGGPLLKINLTKASDKAMRSITDIENELQVVVGIDERNWEGVRSSDRPQIDKVFAVSTAKRRSMQRR